MTQTPTSLASLDETLTVERIRLERVLFRLVLVRLARSEVGGGLAERLMARLEAEMRWGARERISDADTTEATRDAVTETAASAPEPYRTMLLAHLRRFERINEELRFGATTTESEDSLDVLAAEIGYRAARGALAGSVASELASFVRKH